MLKRSLAFLLCLFLLFPVLGIAEGGSEELLSEFILHHGDRESKKIAITVDDCYKSAADYIRKDVELCRQYGVKMTFFPLVYTGCLEEKYRELWQSALDCGCEIGTHSYQHVKFGNLSTWGIIDALGKHQEALDRTLGYHYPIRWLRTPGGTIAAGKKSSQAQVMKAIRIYGFTNVVHWDVSYMKDAKGALQRTKNGSILLFHAKKGDYQCLEKLIPMLLQEGYEPVTLSELFGFDPPETGSELYVYDRDMYRNK